MASLIGCIVVPWVKAFGSRVIPGCWQLVIFELYGFQPCLFTSSSGCTDWQKSVLSWWGVLPPIWGGFEPCKLALICAARSSALPIVRVAKIWSPSKRDGWRYSSICLVELSISITWGRLTAISAWPWCVPSRMTKTMMRSPVPGAPRQRSKKLLPPF